MPTDQVVRGFCPMGCGESLVLDEGGNVACSLWSCPRPTAVAELLEVQETEHVVVFTAERFTVLHPLRERLEGELFACRLHGFLTVLSGPPVKPGRYRAVWVGDTWEFTEVVARG